MINSAVISSFRILWDACVPCPFSLQETHQGCGCPFRGVVRCCCFLGFSFLTACTECRMLCERWAKHLTPPPRVLRPPSPQKQLAPRLAAKAQSLVITCGQGLAISLCSRSRVARPTASGNAGVGGNCQDHTASGPFWASTWVHPNANATSAPSRNARGIAIERQDALTHNKLHPDLKLGHICGTPEGAVRHWRGQKQAPRPETSTATLARPDKHWSRTNAAETRRRWGRAVVASSVGAMHV